MSFNTVYADIICPFCQEKVISGVGFRIGALKNLKYKLGEKISWDGHLCRPAKRPAQVRIKSIGYFNCDNIKCSSWHDCYPQVQKALITIENDVITEVQVYEGMLATDNFDIVEPEGLS